MEPIRLLRWRGAWPNVDEYRRKVEEPTHEQRRLWGCEEYAALPRAEYDALVSRAEKPLDHVMRTSCGHEWTVRHTSCPTCFAALVKERDEARESAVAAGRLLDEHRRGCVWMTWHKEAEDRANAATARAEKAEARIASIERMASEQYAALRGRVERAEALLREARVYVEVMREAAIEEREASDMDIGQADSTTSALLARIDAFLAERPA